MRSTFLKITVISFFSLLIIACDRGTPTNTPANTAAENNAVKESANAVVASAAEEKAPMGKLPDDSLAQMRITLKPYWAPIENGGIILLADIENSAMNVLAFQKLLKLYPGIEQKDNSAWAPLAEKLAERCLALTRQGKMEYGVYELKNYLKEHTEEQMFPFDDKGGAPIGIPDAEVLAFDFTEEHEKLIRHMNVRGVDGNVLLMDFEQPYVGDANIHRAMAMALGDDLPLDAEIPAENKHYYDILQREMIFAVQAFWKYAQMPEDQDSGIRGQKSEKNDSPTPDKT